MHVLGGLGKAGTPDSKKFPIYNENESQTFNNADGWYDDTSDGPVPAKVKLNGTEIPVTGAWVLVAPPNYAPDLIGFRTLYDLMFNLFLEKKPEWILQEAGRVEKTSFTKHIMPLFKRLANLQWVNQGFSDVFNFSGPYNFESRLILQKLASNELNSKKDRELIFNLFRIPGMEKAKAKNHKLWPMLYGDAYGSYDESEQSLFYIAAHQLKHLKNWMHGDFTIDYDTSFQPPATLDEVPLEQQPSMLTKAALDFCLAGARSQSSFNGSGLSNYY